MSGTLIFALLGWVLLIPAWLLYFFGNKLNSRESNALAIFSLAAIVSDDFRTATRAGFEKAIEEARKTGVDEKQIAYGLILAVTGQAKECMRPDAEIATLAIVLQEIRKQR
jgi:hypothetical protein